MAHALDDRVSPLRVRLTGMRTRSKTYSEGEIINVVEFGVEVGELPGRRYTISVPFLWGVGWQTDHARCAPLFPSEFHQDALMRVLFEIDENQISMDVQEAEQKIAPRVR